MADNTFNFDLDANSVILERQGKRSSDQSDAYDSRLHRIIPFI